MSDCNWSLVKKEAASLINCPSNTRKHAAKSAERRGERSALGQEAKEQRKEERKEGQSGLSSRWEQKGTPWGNSKPTLSVPQSLKDPGRSTESLMPSLSQVYPTELAGVRPAPACTPEPPPAHPSPLPTHTPPLPAHPHRCCSGCRHSGLGYLPGALHRSPWKVLTLTLGTRNRAGELW